MPLAINKECIKVIRDALKISTNKCFKNGNRPIENSHLPLHLNGSYQVLQRGPAANLVAPSVECEVGRYIKYYLGQSVHNFQFS